MPREKWTIDNIKDLTGKVYIVTGANAGLGYEASKELARKGADVVMACRSLDRANQAFKTIKSEIPKASLTIIHLDLGSLKSVRKFSEEFKAKYDHLNGLINNAGIMFGVYKMTEDGFESTFGVDHLGHFALTGLLLDVLKKTPKSRVVNVSSFAHTSGEIDFDDLDFKKNGYDPGKAYPRAKLANILFTNELQRRFDKAGIKSYAVSTNPGFVKTGWIRHMRERSRIQAFLIGIGLSILGQSVEMGVLSLLRPTVDEKVRGGEFFNTQGRLRGYPVVKKSSNASYNTEVAHKLWEVSEELTGVKFLN